MKKYNYLLTNGIDIYNIYIYFTKFLTSVGVIVF